MRVAKEYHSEMSLATKNTKITKRPMHDSGIAPARRSLGEGGWIGSIPEGWKVNRGKYELVLLDRPVLSDDGVITCFRDGEVTLRSKRREEGFTFADKECGYQGIEPGDLVVHGMDGFAGAIGISDSRGKGTPVLNVLDSKNDKKYLMYYLRAMAFQDVFLAMSTGIRVRSCDLRWSKLAEFPFVLPPLPEQKAIAGFLDRECGRIDGLRAKIEQQIEKLGEYKKSLITEAVTGKKKVEKRGGGGQWRISSYSQLRDSGVSWIGQVPAGWKVVKLSYRYDVQLGKMLDTAKITGEYLVPYLRNQDVQWNQINTEELPLMDIEPDEREKFCVRNGDLLVCEGGDVGRSAIWRNSEICYIQKAVMRLRAKNGDSDMTNWMYYLMFAAKCNGAFDNVTGKATIAHLPAEKLAINKFPFPLLSEQREIAAYLDEKCGAIEAMVEKCRGELEKLAEYKKSLIFECVTGKREVA